MKDLISGKPNHVALISQRFAISLVGINPLPDTGQEQVIAVTRGGQKLVLTNVADQYWLYSDSCPREHWSLAFGVSVPDSESP